MAEISLGNRPNIFEFDLSSFFLTCISVLRFNLSSADGRALTDVIESASIEFIQAVAAVDSFPGYFLLAS